MIKFIIGLLLCQSAFAAAPTGAYFRNAYTVTPVTTGASVAMTAALPYAVARVQIFDTAGEDMKIICGSTTVAYPPGGGDMPLKCPAGSIISLQAITGNATTGEVLISYFYQ